ncbi:wac domain-containing [Fusarium albosuccineum]|uniref:Wac domain-containing n=1 Tax=Fusarium albosuccineum TaxID=1237068 RepID=A0A8H4KLP6_9HYPO|nr:wac domain-containing [Fusarium albosuccineum]
MALDSITRDEYIESRNAQDAQIYHELSSLRGNSRLRNPHLPIEPIVFSAPAGGIARPDLKLFLQNANEFYALRDYDTPWKVAMLDYLVGLYDVPLHLNAPMRGGRSSDSADSSTDDG